MNAALTFTNCALGRMSWKKFPVYILGQFLGSFLASATIYCLFYCECLALCCPPLASASSSEKWADTDPVSWLVKMSREKALEVLPTPPSYSLIPGTPVEFSWWQVHTQSVFPQQPLSNFRVDI